MNNSELTAFRASTIPQGVAAAAPMYIAKARNALITDVEGRVYRLCGRHRRDERRPLPSGKVVSTVQEQAELFSHTCFGIVGYESYLCLADKLNQHVPGDFAKHLLRQPGAEAVENAVKIARYATGRKSIMAFEDAFHGRTYMTLSLTSQVDPYKVGFGPYASDVYRIPYACTAALCRSPIRNVDVRVPSFYRMRSTNTSTRKMWPRSSSNPSRGRVDSWYLPLNIWA